MSAYVVNRAHILYLVEAAQSKRLNPGSYALTWYYNGRGVQMDRPDVTVEELRRVAQMLWDANVRAVSLRYPGRERLPGPTNGDYTIETADVARNHWTQAAFDPVAVLVSIECYEYQTETEDYEQTEAYAFLRALERRAIHALPGWEDAPWGAPQADMLAVRT